MSLCLNPSALDNSDILREPTAGLCGGYYDWLCKCPCKALGSALVLVTLASVQGGLRCSITHTQRQSVDTVSSLPVFPDPQILIARICRTKLVPSRLLASWSGISHVTPPCYTDWLSPTPQNSEIEILTPVHQNSMGFGDEALNGQLSNTKVIRIDFNPLI